MANAKVITGIAVGVLVALVLIPRSRKVISEALCSLTDSIKKFAGETEEIADAANDVAGSVNSARQAIS